MTARARPVIHSRADDLLAHLYRDVTEQQAARFSAEYDLAGGQGRYAGWLHEQVTGAGICDADRAVTVLYSQHYRALVGLAAFLVRDVPAAEELVQDCFVALHSAWPRLPGHDQAVSFLQRSVIRGSRAPRYDMTAASHPGEPAVITALRVLPARQREAVVLHCYAELADDQIAAAMGVSTAKARGHTAKAMAALRAELQADGSALQIWQGEPG